jgi:hypothetical protein
MPLRTRALLNATKNHAKAKPRNATENSSPQKRREAERQKAHLGAASKSDAARTLSPFLKIREDRGPDPHGARTSWRGRARLSAPHRGIRGFDPGSAQAALPGITGCKREDPLRHQCSEHLAVRHAPDGTMPKPPVSAVYRRAAREPPPLRLKEYPREGVLRRAGFCPSNLDGDKSQETVSFFGTSRLCQAWRRCEVT